MEQEETNNGGVKQEVAIRAVRGWEMTERWEKKYREKVAGKSIYMDGCGWEGTG